MLAWQVFNQSRGLRVRPSELYGISNPLAAFYMDRGIYWWGNFVENKMEEAEQNVRKQMKNRRGTETFIVSARIATFNKLFGLSTASAYRSPTLPPPEQPAESADGTVDLSIFNKREDNGKR